MSSLHLPEELRSEAAAFDARVLERVRHGLVPDLRHAVACDWFFNNPWRHPAYVDLVFGEYFRFAAGHLPKPGSRVLEVGSGLGHMTLELARRGHHVTGLELSPASVEVARRTAAAHPMPEGSGSLEYVNADFMSWEPGEAFDAVCFFLSLHHFTPPDAILARAAEVLAPGGVITVIEPARDWFSETNATTVALVRLLLSAGGMWHADLDLPADEAGLAEYVREVGTEYREAKDRGEAAQSPQDNSAFGTEMMAALRGRFDEIAYRPGFAFTPRLIGGVRGATEEETLRLATFLHMFDEYCVRRGLLQPGVFYYAGRLKPRS